MTTTASIIFIIIIKHKTKTYRIPQKKNQQSYHRIYTLRPRPIGIRAALTE